MSHILPLNEWGGGAPPSVVGQSPPGEVSRKNQDAQDIPETKLSDDSGVEPETSTSSSHHSSGYLCRVNVSWRHSQGRSFKSYMKSQRVRRSFPDSPRRAEPVAAESPDQWNWATGSFKKSTPSASKSQISAQEPIPSRRYMAPVVRQFVAAHPRKHGPTKPLRAAGRPPRRSDGASARRSRPKKDEDKTSPQTKYRKNKKSSVSTATERKTAQTQDRQFYSSILPKGSKPQTSSIGSRKLTWSSYLSPRRQTSPWGGITTSPKKPRKLTPIKWRVYPEDPQDDIKVPILQKPDVQPKPKMKTEEEIYAHLDSLGRDMINFIEPGLYHEHHRDRHKKKLKKKKQQKLPQPAVPHTQPQYLHEQHVELDLVEEYVQQLQILQQQMQHLKTPKEQTMSLALPAQQPVQEAVYPQLQMEVPQEQQPDDQQYQYQYLQWQPYQPYQTFHNEAIQPSLIQQLQMQEQLHLQELEELRIYEEEMLEQQKKQKERIEKYEHEQARQQMGRYLQHLKLQDELLHQLKMHEEWLQQRSTEQSSLEQSSMEQEFMQQSPLQQSSMQEQPLVPVEIQSLIDPSLSAPLKHVLQASLAALYGSNDQEAVLIPTHLPEWSQRFPSPSNQDGQSQPSSILPKPDLLNHGDGAGQDGCPAKPAEMSLEEPVQKDDAKPDESEAMVAKSPPPNTSNAGDGNDDTGKCFVRAVGDPYYMSPGAPKVSLTQQSFPYLTALKQPEEAQPVPPKSWRAQAPPAVGNVAKVPFRATMKQDACKPRFNQYAGNKTGQTSNYNAANYNRNGYNGQKKMQAGTTPRTYNKIPFNQRKGQKEPVVPVAPKPGTRTKTKAQKTSRQVDAQGFVQVGGGGGGGYGGEAKKMPHKKPAGSVIDRRNPFKLLVDNDC
ncbi:hypothetical protein KR074_007946 [Drosophila pseudoananassae]|nr:hypothetical protein KR074_007946 [Drosophila pseudoananassae]